VSKYLLSLHCKEREGHSFVAFFPSDFDVPQNVTSLKFAELTKVFKSSPKDGRGLWRLRERGSGSVGQQEEELRNKKKKERKGVRENVTYH
jgi:hypothetical protein